MKIKDRIAKVRKAVQVNQQSLLTLTSFGFDNTRPEPGSPWPQSPPDEREPPFDKWDNWDKWDNK